VFGQMSAKELAVHLRDWASKVNMEKIKKAPPRKPTEQKTECIGCIPRQWCQGRLFLVG
jgi:hypothetical protein